VLDDRLRHVPKQHLTMLRGTVQLPTGIAMTHFNSPSKRSD